MHLLKESDPCSEAIQEAREKGDRLKRLEQELAVKLGELGTEKIRIRPKKFMALIKTYRE
jgi:hypothetical protein